jgi:hypothetical protein
MSEMYPPPSSGGQAPHQPGSQVGQTLLQPEGAPAPPSYVKTNVVEYWTNARNGKRNLSILAVVFVMCMIIGSLGHGSSGASTDTGSSVASTNQTGGHSTASAQPTNPPAPTHTPAPTFAHFGDGTFEVGKDIHPGTYRTREASSGCYYARLKGFSGSLDDIITNDNTDAPAVVTIAASDKGFQSRDCGTWTQDLSQITTSKTTFDDGTYIVGTDLEPGTYKSSGVQGCYWARLSGFGGTLDEIIANDNTDSAAIVTISASDKGFQSKGCGTWVKE